MIYKSLKIFQAYILINYGNVAYQRISGDTYFDNVPSDLNELWNSPYNFSFKKFKDIKEIPYLKEKALLRYYSDLVNIFIKLNIIFKKIERRF